MDKNLSIEDVFKNIVRTEIELLFQRLIDVLANKEGIVTDSKPLCFKDTCAYIPCSSSYLYKMTSQNLIPHYKKGKKLYFAKKDLDAWLVENRVRTIDEIKSDVLSMTLKRKR